MIFRLFKFLVFVALFSPFYLSAQITSYPYIEDFESGPAGWTIQGVNPSWELGTPNGYLIQAAASGSNAWVTNLDGFPNSNESSWLESPTYDLSSLTEPYVQLNVWYNCFFSTGALIQSSIDNGSTWQMVGALEAEPNWYNSNNIITQPGGSLIGWSGFDFNLGGSNGWITAYHDLQDLFGESNVRFRVVFATTFNGGTVDGFAFDNFSILETPCYAGEDDRVSIIGCFLLGGMENLNDYLTTGANQNGTWTALDGLAITSNGDIEITNTENGTYRFQYTVSTENGACIDSATITIDFQQTLSAGTSNTVETCGGDEFFRNDMFDFIELYFGGPDTTGVWTDSNGDDVSFPIYPFDSDVYTYTHEAISGCPEQSSTVTFVQPPILEAGESQDLQDLGCNPPPVLNLTNKLIGADPGGQWRTLLTGDPIDIDTTDDGNGGTVDEVDFGTLGAGSYYFKFEYSVQDDCGLSVNSSATFEFEIFISTSGVSSINLAICENEFISEDFLNNFVNEDGTGLGSWDYTGSGPFGNVGAYEFSNGCGEPSGTINVYLNALQPKIFLQGAMLNPNPGEENLMRDDLRVLGHLPSISPYSDGASTTNDPFSITGPNAIVDWVWVELRDEDNNTIVAASQSALLQRDGDVVGLDGTSALCFKEDELNPTALLGNYYVVIKHRNHLGIMTANTIPIGSSHTATVVDFTDVNTPITYGTNAQSTFGMPANKFGMWAGDVDGNQVSQYVGSLSETSSMLSFVMGHSSNIFDLPTWEVEVYNNFDVNLNGSTQYVGSNSELPFILQNIYAFPGNIFGLPTWAIEAQLP